MSQQPALSKSKSQLARDVGHTISFFNYLKMKLKNAPLPPSLYTHIHTYKYIHLHQLFNRKIRITL